MEYLRLSKHILKENMKTFEEPKLEGLLQKGSFYAKLILAERPKASQRVRNYSVPYCIDNEMTFHSLL